MVLSLLMHCFHVCPQGGGNCTGIVTKMAFVILFLVVHSLYVHFQSALLLKRRTALHALEVPPIER